MLGVTPTGEPDTDVLGVRSVIIHSGPGKGLVVTQKGFVITHSFRKD